MSALTKGKQKNDADDDDNVQKTDISGGNIKLTRSSFSLCEQQLNRGMNKVNSEPLFEMLIILFEKLCLTAQPFQFYPVNFWLCFTKIVTHIEQEIQHKFFTLSKLTKHFHNI